MTVFCQQPFFLKKVSCVAEATLVEMIRLEGGFLLPVPVIDFHIHPVRYDLYCASAEAWIKAQQPAKDWPAFIEKYGDPVEFSRFLAECGVDYGVVMAELSPVTTGICRNEYVAPDGCVTTTRE